MQGLPFREDLKAKGVALHPPGNRANA